MEEYGTRALSCVLLVPPTPAGSGIVQRRKTAALLTSRGRMRCADSALKRKVRTWGLWSKVRFWCECQLEPLLRGYVLRRQAVRRRQRATAWHGGR
jgi:hypothetical protein